MNRDIAITAINVGFVVVVIALTGLAWRWRR